MKLKHNEVRIELTENLQDIVGNTFMLKGVSKIFKYEGKVKTDEIIGYTYAVNCKDVGETVNVKIMGNLQVDSNMEFSRLGVPVEFKGLNGKVWIKTENNFVTYNLSMIAESIMVVNEKASLPKI